MAVETSEPGKDEATALKPQATSERARRQRRRREDPAAGTRTSSSTQVKSTVDEIMKHVHAHIEYNVPFFTANIRNLPEFENLTQYGISAPQSDVLWTLEAGRLLNSSAGTGPLMFEDDSLGEISIGGYGKIRDAAKRIACAIMIGLHDNMIVMMENKPTSFDLQTLKWSTLSLHREIDEPAKRSGDEAKDVLLCHALINYITAIFARMLEGTLDDTGWKMACIGILVRIATKTKVLCRDPRGQAMRSIRLGDNAKNRMIARAHLRFRPGYAMSDDEDSDDDDRGGGTNYYVAVSGRKSSRVSDLRPGEMDATEFYTGGFGGLRHDMYRMVLTVLENLSESNRPGVPIEAFELSTLLSKTSFEKSSFALSQDRRGQIAVTAGVAALEITSFALGNLQSTLGHVKRHLSRAPSKPPVGGAEGGTTTTGTTTTRAHALVRWQKTEDGSPPADEFFELSSVRDILSVMVAACCTFPQFGMLLEANNSLGNLIHQVAIPGVVSLPHSTFLFSIGTRAYEESQPRTTSIGAVRSLSRSLIAHHRLLVPPSSSRSADGIIMEKGPAAGRVAKEIEERLRLVEPRRKALRQLSEEIENSWQFDDDSVTIGCWKYAGTVALMCTALVGGGMVVGFTVGERIPGVDPFNVTVFCWALAAFILVVAKSARVQDWPWRDFLRGRVVCRSLSELCVVTGTDEQDVLAWLLQNEQSTVLQTKGPYNKLFGRRGDWGFSIDCMAELGTMVLSGTVVLEVQTQMGPALVCLDARPGVAYRAYVNSNQPNEGEMTLACIEPPPKENPKAIATLRPLRLGWSSVLGVYNVPGRLFR